MEDKPPSRSAGVSPAGGGASRPRFGDVTIRDRGRLPHWERDAGLYFITFRLADSLPQEVLRTLDSRLPALSPVAKPAALQERQLQRMRLIERYLDKGSGTCFLRNPALAELAANALRFGDGNKYRLLSWCVMPNHVHVLARLLPGVRLAPVLHSWKSYTAKRANEMLHRKGAFWQREYFDRVVRNDEQLERTVRYIANNPIKAGLRDWNWVFATPELRYAV